jgi:NADH-quinone oxidoreductase subunit L
MPMGALAALSILGGVLGLSIETGTVQRFLEPVLGPAVSVHGGLSEVVLSVIATLVAAAGLALGWFAYGSGAIDWMALRSRLALAHRTMERGFYVDDAYGLLFVLPGKAAAAFTAYVFDQGVVDRAVNGLGEAFRKLAAVGRRVQTGLVRSYALAFLLGAVAVVLILVARA